MLYLLYIQVKNCQLCSFVAPNLRYLLQHIRQVHAHQHGFHLVCGLSGCERMFRTFTVYRNHVYDRHSDLVANMGNEVMDDDNELGDHNESEHELADDPAINSRMRSAAMWILKIQETHGIPQSTMMEILKDVTGFVQDLLSDLFKDVKSVLVGAGIPTDIPGLTSLQSAYAHPFSGLESQYSQLQFYKKAFNFVVLHIFLLNYQFTLYFAYLGTPVFSFGY